MGTTNRQITSYEKSKAFHEAGHIVAALNRGISVRSATIVPQEGSQAFVTMGSVVRHLSPQERKLPSNWPRVEAELVTLFAGPIAEKLYEQAQNHRDPIRPVASTFARHANNDCHEAEILGREIHSADADLEACLDQISDIVHQEIIDSWPRVVAVAEALAVKRTLGAADIFLAFHGQ
jgi:hypothetical protein